MIVDAVVAGLAGAIVIGAGLGYLGWHRWVGALAGPAIGVAIIVGANLALSKASLNPDDGGDMSAQIWGQVVGFVVIVLYVIAYSADAVARWAALRHRRAV
jgi:hypothetical protein